MRRVCPQFRQHRERLSTKQRILRDVINQRSRLRALLDKSKELKVWNPESDRYVFVFWVCVLILSLFWKFEWIKITTFRRFACVFVSFKKF